MDVRNLWLPQLVWGDCRVRRQQQRECLTNLRQGVADHWSQMREHVFDEPQGLRGSDCAEPAAGRFVRQLCLKFGEAIVLSFQQQQPGPLACLGG